MALIDSNFGVDPFKYRTVINTTGASWAMIVMAGTTSTATLTSSRGNVANRVGTRTYGSTMTLYVCTSFSNPGTNDTWEDPAGNVSAAAAASASYSESGSVSIPSLVDGVGVSRGDDATFSGTASDSPSNTPFQALTGGQSGDILAVGLGFSTAPGTTTITAPSGGSNVVTNDATFGSALYTAPITGSASFTPRVQWTNSSRWGGVAVILRISTMIITGPSGAAGASTSTANIAENATTGPTFSTSATPGSGFPTLTGTDASLFTLTSIASNSWRVDPSTAFNFESLPHANPFVVTFNASGSVSQTCTITITNVNEAPSFTGTLSVPTLTQSVAMSSINAATFFSDPDSGDTGTYTAVGSWPAGITVSSAGLISGTPTTPGTYSSLRVRRTDSGSLTADSNLFTITVATVLGSVTTDVLENQNGTPCSSVTVNYSWYLGGRIGALTGITPQEGTAVTNAQGQLTVTGLPTGAGVLLTNYRQTLSADDVIHYHTLTAA